MFIVDRNWDSLWLTVIVDWFPTRIICSRACPESKIENRNHQRIQKRLGKYRGAGANQTPPAKNGENRGDLFSGVMVALSGIVVFVFVALSLSM